MTNGNVDVSAVRAVNVCCVTVNFSFREVPSSGALVIASSCYCHSCSNVGELFHIDKKVNLVLLYRWPLSGMFACSL